MEKKNLPPGTVIFARSNPSPRYDCFGVIVNADFWQQAAEREGIYPSQVLKEYYEPDMDQVFRVLGRRFFPKTWRVGVASALEPDAHVFMHYRFWRDSEIYPVDLRPILELSKMCDSRVGQLLLNLGINSHIRKALSDAEIVYAYLDRKRTIEGKLISKEDEMFFRLLEQAVPL